MQERIWKRVSLLHIVDNSGLITDGDWIESKDQDPNGDVKIIQLADIGEGNFLSKSNRFLTSEKAKKLRCTYLLKNDILVARMPEPLGRACLFPEHETPCVTVVDVCIVRPNSDVNRNWLVFLINSPEFHQKVINNASGTTRTRISKSSLIKINFLIPPKDEQKKMVEILSTWDKAIATCEKLISTKQTRKRVLMQRLLTGKQRFPQFHNKEWKTVRLGDVARNSALRNNLGMTSENLMAVTKSSGIIPMREQVQGKTVDRCKVVQPNWFAYNPMRLNIGSIARWTGSEKVMVSPDYVVFKCDEKYLKPEYLDHFRKTYFWSQFVNRSGDGSVRVRIYFSHLEDMKISLPSIGEQEKIAETLNAADREIELLKQQRDALKRQKRGLMQKLLTGKVRVRVDEIEKNNGANSDI